MILLIVVIVSLLSLSSSLSLSRDKRQESIYLTTRDGVNLFTEIIYPRDAQSSGYHHYHHHHCHYHYFQ